MSSLHKSGNDPLVSDCLASKSIGVVNEAAQDFVCFFWLWG